MKIITIEDNQITKSNQEIISADGLWVDVEDYKTLKALANEMFGQLELMNYEKEAKETYDEFKEELVKLELKDDNTQTNRI